MADSREMYERFKLYGSISLLFIVISVVFAYFISKKLQRSISTPILELADTARQVSEERNYSVRAIKKNDDEVGDLTEAFNHMLTRIGSQNAEITGLNLNLEQKVRERTRELEETNLELKLQTEFSERILDSTVDLIAVFDTELRYVTMNRQFEEIYKVSKHAIAGRYVAEVFPQVVESGMIDDLQRALKGEFVRNINYISKITGRHYENFYIPLKDKNNNIYQVLTIAHDITDIMQANVKLQTVNAELAKSNSELEQFAYVASHDLQEPLRKIQTFSELSQRNLNNQDLLNKYLQKVNSSAQRMTELIKAVLNYSRLTKVEKEFVQVDLNSILERMITDLELLIEEKKAVIHYERLPVLNGIPLQLHQLFLNLVTNSLKFNDNIPEITISSKIVSGKDVNPAFSNAEYAELVFTDNGIGFDQKFQDKIFSIFQRLHIDRNFPGTGIGLALCKKIVENHSGMISVISEPAKGSSFHIYLPYAKVKQDQLTNISSTKK
jgi:PAS domain S-box-containing protein